MLPPYEDRPRIIVAEDHLEIREVLTCALEEEGFEVLAVTDGGELLDALEQIRHGGRVDAVVSDVQMPRANGLDCLSAARALSPTLPVVLISALYDEALEREALQRGASAVIAKPFQLQRLIDLLRALLGPRPLGPLAA